MRRIFVILPPFEREWTESGLHDDSLRLLQIYILQNPNAGELIKGTHGIRKLRWSIDGKGKRSGLRIFYLDFPDYYRIYLITLIRKSVAQNLTKSELNQLGSMVLELRRLLHTQLNFKGKEKWQ